MFENLFTWLTNAFQGNPGIAILSSFLWGIFSILLSPCHLSSIPLIIGFIQRQGEIKPGKALGLSFTFAAGILVTIILIGVITASLGRLMGDIGRFGTYFIAGIFIIAGLYLLDWIKLPWAAQQHQTRRSGYSAALILGLLFGIGLGPCTFAYMAPMLGVVFQVAATRYFYAAVLLLAFGLGHCFVIVLAGSLTHRVQEYLNWTERTRGAQIIRKVCGILVIFGGVYLFFTSI
ncbi:cytochrome C biogenesis protein [bacterium]|nr:cytochrome C biogenesis protein [bacterium]